MVFSIADVGRSLPHKGFALDKSGDHRRYYFYYNGKRTRFHTYTSHGKSGDVVGDDLVRSMKMQLGLDTLAQVRQLVECTMSEAQYVAALTTSGKMPAAQAAHAPVQPATKGRR